jgi:single-stranded-DNA-specific exonuclease
LGRASEEEEEIKKPIFSCRTFMKKWNILSQTGQCSHENIQKLLLKNRGFVKKAEIEEFLNPLSIETYVKKLPLEFRQSLKKAKDIILKAISDKKPIIIYGDYDSDGINATAILYSTIKDELKYKNVSYFIPNRFDHGYGLTIRALDVVVSTQKKENLPLVVTVDTGITAFEEVSYLKSLGYSVILTDHHQGPKAPPPADCIVWCDEISGAGISYLLSRVLGSKNKESIALAALATVTDLYPVVGINRSIVKSGLKVLNVSPPLGLKKLIKVSGKEGFEVTTYDLGWVLGPRLNASGRLKDANVSLELLLEKNEKRAEALAAKLNESNIARQDKTLEMYGIASSFDESNLPRILFSRDKNYHEGIIGLVAAKLSQKYYRPAVVISLSEEYGKGSVRSVSGVNIIEMLRNFEDLFESLGGHPMAAGFTIKIENIPVLEERMLELATSVISDELLTPVLDIDLKMPIGCADLSLLKEIEKLKPFGLGNSEPVFMSESLSVTKIDKMGKESQHVRLALYDGKKFYKAVWFNGAELASDLSLGAKIDIVYTLKRNEYNGSVYVDLVVRDVRVLG